MSRSANHPPQASRAAAAHFQLDGEPKPRPNLEISIALVSNQEDSLISGDPVETTPAELLTLVRLLARLAVHEAASASSSSDLFTPTTEDHHEQ